jgi:hypothetical protein
MKSFAPVFALALTLSAGVAAQPPPPEARLGPPPPPRAHPACFWTRSIDNFATNNDEVLYLRTSRHDVWELKLFSHCMNVDWVQHLAILSRPGGFATNVCEGPNPPIDVVVRQPGFGRQSCPVTFVRRLTPTEAAALPKLARP